MKVEVVMQSIRNEEQVRCPGLMEQKDSITKRVFKIESNLPQSSEEIACEGRISQKLVR